MVQSPLMFTEAYGTLRPCAIGSNCKIHRIGQNQAIKRISLRLAIGIQADCARAGGCDEVPILKHYFVAFVFFGRAFRAGTGKSRFGDAARYNYDASARHESRIFAPHHCLSLGKSCTG